jgi:hypothetical protein
MEPDPMQFLPLVLVAAISTSGQVDARYTQPSRYPDQAIAGVSAVRQRRQPRITELLTETFISAPRGTPGKVLLGPQSICPPTLYPTLPDDARPLLRTNLFPDESPPPAQEQKRDMQKGGVNKETFDRIMLGMTPAEVETVVGHKPDSEMRLALSEMRLAPDDDLYVSWQEGTCLLTVHYSSGKVSNLSFTVSPNGFTCAEGNTRYISVTIGNGKWGKASQIGVPNQTTGWPPQKPFPALLQPDVTRQTFEQIKIGMAEAEVQALIRCKPYRTYARGPKCPFWASDIWFDGWRTTITVDYAADITKPDEIRGMVIGAEFMDCSVTPVLLFELLHSSACRSSE